MHTYHQEPQAACTDRDASISPAKPRSLGSISTRNMSIAWALGRERTRVPFAGAAQRRSCWPRRASGCRAPGPSIRSGGRPSRGRASGSVGRGSCSGVSGARGLFGRAGCAQHDGLVARHCCFRREAAARSCSSNWVGDASDSVRGGRGRCRTLLWLPCSMVGGCWLGVAARDVPGRDALTSGRLSGSAFVTGLVRK